MTNCNKNYGTDDFLYPCAVTPDLFNVFLDTVLVISILALMGPIKTKKTNNKANFYNF